MHISVDIVQVLDETWLVAVSEEQGRQFSIIHTSVDCSLADFEAIDMNYWQDCTGFLRVDILCGVPAPVPVSIYSIWSIPVVQEFLT